MKTYTLNTKTTLAAATLIMGTIMGGQAQAETCQPLHVTNIVPRVMHTGTVGGKSSVSFLVDTYVKNDNPQLYRTDGTRKKAFFTWHYIDASGNTQYFDQQTVSTYIVPGGRVRFNAGDKYTVAGNTYASWIIDLELMMINDQCQSPRKRFVKTTAKYDFNPVRTGGSPKLLSGRMHGYRPDNGGINRPQRRPQRAGQSSAPRPRP